MNKSKAIEYFGSTRLLAEALNITPQAIGQWGDVVPARRQYEIEKVTGGKLKATAYKASLHAAAGDRS